MKPVGRLAQVLSQKLVKPDRSRKLVSLDPMADWRSPSEAFKHEAWQTSSPLLDSLAAGSKRSENLLGQLIHLLAGGFVGAYDKRLIPSAKLVSAKLTDKSSRKKQYALESLSVVGPYRHSGAGTLVVSTNNTDVPLSMLLAPVDSRLAASAFSLAGHTYALPIPLLLGYQRQYPHLVTTLGPGSIVDIATRLNMIDRFAETDYRRMSVAPSFKEILAYFADRIHPDKSLTSHDAYFEASLLVQSKLPSLLEMELEAGSSSVSRLIANNREEPERAREAGDIASKQSIGARKFMEGVIKNPPIKTIELSSSGTSPSEVSTGLEQN